MFYQIGVLRNMIRKESGEIKILDFCMGRYLKGPFKYFLMPLLGKNQFAITLQMCASTGPNLDNSHRELKWISS